MNTKRKRDYQEANELYEDEKNSKRLKDGRDHVVPLPPTNTRGNHDDDDDKMDDTSDNFVHHFMNNINGSIENNEQEARMTFGIHERAYTGGDDEGQDIEIMNALGRLQDDEYYDNDTYEQQQIYTQTQTQKKQTIKDRQQHQQQHQQHQQQIQQQQQKTTQQIQQQNKYNKYNNNSINNNNNKKNKRMEEERDDMITSRPSHQITKETGGKKDEQQNKTKRGETNKQQGKKKRIEQEKTINPLAPSSPRNIIKIEEKTLKSLYKRLIDLTQDVEMIIHSKSNVTPQSLQLCFRATELIPHNARDASMYDDQTEHDLKMEERDDDEHQEMVQVVDMEDETQRIPDSIIRKNFEMKERIFLAATEIYRLFDYKNQKTFIALCRRKNICFYEACSKNWKRLKNKLNISYRSYSMKYYLISDLIQLAKRQNMGSTVVTFRAIEKSMRSNPRFNNIFVRTAPMTQSKKETDFKGNTSISSIDEGRVIIVQSLMQTNDYHTDIHAAAAATTTRGGHQTKTHHHHHHQAIQPTNQMMKNINPNTINMRSDAAMSAAAALVHGGNPLNI